MEGRRQQPVGGSNRRGEAPTQDARSLRTGGDTNSTSFRRGRMDSLDESGLRSPDSIPTLHSEQELSDDERVGSPSRTPLDRRQFVEAHTPSLVDEEDFADEEEQEMIAYIDRDPNNPYFLANDDSSSNVRRTPGAQMFKGERVQSAETTEGMRRTPGADQMHRSSTHLSSNSSEHSQLQSTSSHSLKPPPPQVSGASAVNRARVSSEDGNESAPLGYGLSLSTPVARSSRSQPKFSSNQDQLDPSSRRIQSIPINWDAGVPRNPETQQGSTPERTSSTQAKQGDPKESFGSTWNISSGRSNVYSPNTLRLTEDLGNLLLEEESLDIDPPKALSSQPMFGGASATESWTSSYVVSKESPARVHRGGTSSRRGRGKSDSRRSRGYDRSSAQRQNQGAGATGGFLPYAQQPKAVRGMYSQPTAFMPFSGEPQLPFSQTPSQSDAQAPDQSRAPTFQNIGGAFAPPRKGMPQSSSAQSADASQGSFTPESFPQDQTGMNFPPSFPGNAPMFGSSDPAYNPQFQAYAPAPNFGGPAVPQGQTPFQHQYPSQQIVFGSGFVERASPSPHGFQPPPSDTSYQPQPGGIRQDFNTDTQTPVQQQQAQQDSQAGQPTVWQQPLPGQYVQPVMPPSGWQGASAGAWTDNSYSGEYAISPIPLVDARGDMTPTPTWQLEPELAMAGATMYVPSPSPQSVPQGAPQEGRTSRNQNKGKNQRKNASKKGKPQNRRTPTPTQPSGKKASNQGNKGKKKNSKDRAATPAAQSTTSQITANDDYNAVASTGEAAESKRAELIEAPAVRSAFKDFFKKFRDEEGKSFQDAQAFAMQTLEDGSLPESIHWRVYLELADLAKRSNRFSEARKLYRQVCRLQPFAAQGWLEFSKLEEECGNMGICTKLLRAGLGYCEYNEHLFIRSIKHEEKMGNLARARELLARLKHFGIDKVWRVVLEGALMEARSGNYTMARRVMKYLMHHVPWYGPLYLEAYRLERDLGKPKDALAIVEKGLKAIPRYGPLWFGSFRLCEAIDHEAGDNHLPLALSMTERAASNISKELLWKVHLGAAQMLERAALDYVDEESSSGDSSSVNMLEMSRKKYAMTLLSCPLNLRWKVMLAAGRMEVAAGNTETARRIFLRAQKVVPEKGRSITLLECARLEEFCGDSELASAILCKSRALNATDWKVWLEGVLFEIRRGRYSRAIDLAQLALRTHSGTGRLWASLVQLHHYNGGERTQFVAFNRALNAVPKSGEVWCEGARIHLNPFSHTFDVDRARRHLFFATKFTRQYGDGFLESLRLEILDQWLSPIAVKIWKASQKYFPVNADTDSNDLMKYVFRVSLALISLCGPKGQEGGKKKPDTSRLPKAVNLRLDKETTAYVLSNLKLKAALETIEVSALRLRCANADPNYGSLWFYCRNGLNNTSRRIFDATVKLMVGEIREHAHLYLAAFIRRFAVVAVYNRTRELGHHNRSSSSGGEEKSIVEEDSVKWEQGIDRRLLAAPSLKEIFDGGNIKYTSVTDMDLLESTMVRSDFVTGLVDLSRHTPMEKMSLQERRKALFGSDALFS